MTLVHCLDLTPMVLVEQKIKQEKRMKMQFGKIVSVERFLDRRVLGKDLFDPELVEISSVEQLEVLGYEFLTNSVAASEVTQQGGKLLVNRYLNILETPVGDYVCAIKKKVD